MKPILPENANLPRPLVDAWRADVPSTGELRRGYTRFMRQSPTRSVPLLARWLVGGLVLGIGLAQAATVVPARWLGRQEPTAPTPARVAKPLAEGPRKSVPAPLTPSPPPAITSSSDDAPRAIMLTPPRASVSAQPVTAQWQRVADALRANDSARAQSALLEVELSRVGAERDAARLSRAQLLSTSGRRAEALTLARELSNSEGSVVREKARALAASLAKENDAQDRSTEPGAAVKRP